MPGNSEKQTYHELIFIFHKNEIAAEFFYSDFSKILNKSSQMTEFATQKVQCVYAAVSGRLALLGAVCFELQFDELGAVIPDFTVPLTHLLETAGAGPDFGTGSIRLACKSQCSISWQAQNLWEPVGKDTDHTLHKVQRVLWRNNLDLIISNDPVNADAYFPSAVLQTVVQKSETKIDKTIDEQGRISPKELIRQHTVQIEKLKNSFRENFVNQQQEYLLQVKTNREEIQQLKVELRMEQQRSLRLQQLLRGESRL